MAGMDDSVEPGDGMSCPDCGGRFDQPATRGTISCGNGHMFRPNWRAGTIERVPDEHIAHVIDGRGVTPIEFARNGFEYTNTEAITIKPGAVLDLGNGMTLSNRQTLPFTYTLEAEAWPPPGFLDDDL